MSRVSPKPSAFDEWISRASKAAAPPLGIDDFQFADLFEPLSLARLHQSFCSFYRESDEEAFGRFEQYRQSQGAGCSPPQVSEILMATATQVSVFLARLFGVERERGEALERAREDDPVWEFKKSFAKKRLWKQDAGKAWAFGSERAASVARRALTSVGADATCLGSGSEEEELTVARGVLVLLGVEDTARKVLKSGGAAWTPELRRTAARVRLALLEGGPGPIAEAAAMQHEIPSDEEDLRVVTLALDAVESWLSARRSSHDDRLRHWPSVRAPAPLHYDRLVELRRPSPGLPELFVGPEEHLREREGFALTDRRMSARGIEGEVDYCLYCHDREKDSCSRGMHDPKSGVVKKNPLGVELQGCPLDEKISEMNMVRRGGDSLAALALVCLDNPMCPGTGHRICNDCMKGCIFQKQEPVNIPQIETAVLTEVLALPWGFEIYGLLTRWNPLDVRRPYALPYNGKNVLVVGLGPAGYTLSHYLSREGFAVAAIDGLKIEPLPQALLGSEGRAPLAIRDFATLTEELDERILLGFGGVSEYGITVRWDKNFLAALYVTLSRQRLLRIYGGVRFGGTVTLDDAWALGFDHVALAAGAGKPTIIDIKNNLARGIRKASDFLMSLQLTGAYKASSLANLQVRLPALVIGGGLTAIDTATELLAYYLVQVEKTEERITALRSEKGEASVRQLFDDEEWGFIEEQLRHAGELRAERERAARLGGESRTRPLLAKWGGVLLAYRKSVVDSPAYRLNHEEVAKSLEEGVQYLENMSPTEAVLDEHGAVKAMLFERQVLDAGRWRSSGEFLELPARTVCVAAGTSPNVTYASEDPGALELDRRGQYFRGFRASVSEQGDVALHPASEPKEAFFTSYQKGKRLVSYYGDNHPHYAGSVVKAMASAKDGFLHVAQIFAHELAHDASTQTHKAALLRDLHSRLDDEWIAHVHEVNRLTPTIVEVVVRAKGAARKFQPGQFYRLQNFEQFSPVLDDTRLSTEGMALTGAWVDKERGLLSFIVLEMGTSSRLCALLTPGEQVVVMGPTGTPTEIPADQTVLLCGGGLGNAVLFSIAKALKQEGARVIYFAGYKKGEDLFKREDIESSTDQVIWCTDVGAEIVPQRPQDRHVRGNIVQAMVRYANGEVGGELIGLREVSRIIAIGSDRMMAAIKEARHGVLAHKLDPRHLAIASINSPMQCMMKEICAQCLQKHVDPETGKETVVFTCVNQDQLLDRVDFAHLAQRLRSNTAQEKLSNAWLDRIFRRHPGLVHV